MSRGSWTPVDASGAGLSFVSAVGVSPGGQWTTLENYVFCSFTLTYPATVDARVANIGGLPFANGADLIDFHMSNAAAAIGVTHWLINPGSTSFISEAAGAAAAKTNTDLSGKTLSGTFFYRIS